MKIEINTRKHFAVLGWQHRQLVADNPWFSGHTKVTTYGLDERLGTKLRTLYQPLLGRASVPGFRVFGDVPVQ